jgi:glyoxylase-like metal-dependent hydrolase (beta-lactamase superfamily II)
MQIPVGQMANFSYIIADVNSKKAAIIDPSWDLDKISNALKQNKWEASYVINTHTHFDHVLGNDYIVKLTGAQVIQERNSKLNRKISVSDGDIIQVGNIKIRILHTPGHSPESMCLVLDEPNLVFTGDTLFVGNCGRVDLPGSNVNEMYYSLFEKVSKLKESMTIYPGHDYGQFPTSTIGLEKKNNYVLQPRSLQEFITFMTAGDD